MATKKINTSRLLDVDSLVAGDKRVSANEFDGLYSAHDGGTKDTDALVALAHARSEVAGHTDDLIITVEVGKTVTVTDYFKSNGKAKFNLLVGNEYNPENPAGYQPYNMIESGWNVGSNYNAASEALHDRKGNVVSSLTTTAFNDTVDLSGLQNSTPATKATYIKKGLNVKTVQGNDVITGSLLNDTISAGIGNDTITVQYNNGTYGDDIVNLTKGEHLTVNVKKGEANVAEAQIEMRANKNDVITETYSKATLGYEKINTVNSAAGKVYDLQVTTTKEGVGDPAVTDIKYWNGTAYVAFTDGEAELKTALKAQCQAIALAEAGTADDYQTLVGVGEVPVYTNVVDLKKDAEHAAEVTHYTKAQDAYLVTTNKIVYDGDWDGPASNFFAISSEEVPAVTAAYYRMNVTNQETGVVNTEYKKYTGDDALAKVTADITAYGNGADRTFNQDPTYMGSVTVKNAAKAGAEVTVAGVNLLTEAFNVIDAADKKGKVTGTVFGDNINFAEKAATDTTGAGYTIDAGAGNDSIVGSAFADTISAGVGTNAINYTLTGNTNTAIGNDVINLTKGETTTVTFTGAVDGQVTYSVDGNDIKATVHRVEGGVAVEGVLNTITFKNAAKSADATVKVHDFNHDDVDIATLAVNAVQLSNEKTKYSSSVLGSNVTVAAGTNKDLTVDLSKSKQANTVILTNAAGKVTVKGGSVVDAVTDSADGNSNATYTLGLGANALTYKAGDDVVNVTAGEQLTITSNDAAFHHYAVVKNDVVFYKEEDETHGSVTIKNFASKDVAGAGWVKAKVDGEAPKDIEGLNYNTTWSEAEGSKLTSKTTKFTGTRLNDNVDAQAFVVKNKAGNVIAVGGEGYDKAKGVNVDVKDGANLFTGSNYADTLKAGAGNDSITASAGNDVYTLGASEELGNNQATYDLTNNAVNYYNDTYNLSKDETLNFVMTNAVANQVTYHKVGNDIVADLAGKTTLGYIEVKFTAEQRVAATFDWDEDTNTTTIKNGAYRSATTTGFNGDPINITEEAPIIVIGHVTQDNFVDNTYKAFELQYAVDGEGTELVASTLLDAIPVAFENVGSVGGNSLVDANVELGTVTLKNYAQDKTGAVVEVGGASIWNNTINIEATGATVNGTWGNDAIVSDRAAATTFVETYAAGKNFKNNTITVDLGEDEEHQAITKKAADTIKIATSDKNAVKVSAYDLNYAFDTDTLTVNAGATGSIAYTGDFSKGLNFVDATNAKWSFYADTVTAGDSHNIDLTATKGNNIVIANGEAANIKDSKKNDIILGAAGAQTFNYTAGKDLYKGGAEADIYNVDLDKKTTLIVSDTTGVNNLDLDEHDEYALFFNVNANGSMAATTNLSVIDMSTFYKYDRKEEEYTTANVNAAKSLKNGGFVNGTVVLENAIAYNGEAVGSKTAVANYQIDGGAINVETIRTNVAAWFATEAIAAKGYADVNDVLAKGDKTDITAVMAIYNPQAV